MYRQSQPHFGKPSYRINSLPENYSGNAFAAREPEPPAEKPAPAFDEREEEERALSCEEKKDRAHLLFPGISVSPDTAILFLVLLVLAAGGGEREDGALLTILILLLL